MDWLFLILVPGFLGYYLACRGPEPPCPKILCFIAFIAGAGGSVLFKILYPVKGDFGGCYFLSAVLTGVALAVFIIGWCPPFKPRA